MNLLVYGSEKRVQLSLVFSKKIDTKYRTAFYFKIRDTGYMHVTLLAARLGKINDNAKSVQTLERGTFCKKTFIIPAGRCNN